MESYVKTRCCEWVRLFLCVYEMRGGEGSIQRVKKLQLPLY